MPRSNTYKWFNLLFFIAVIVVNALSQLLPINGKTPKDISDMYYTLITPAGYAFSIWSIIYILLAGFIVYTFRSSTPNSEAVQSISVWFIISCVFNIAWIFLWHYLYTEWSLLAIVGLLISLIFIYRNTRAINRPTSGEHWFVQLPFSIYLGWISIATIINVAVVLTKNNWDGFGISDVRWSLIILGVGAILAVLAVYPYRDGVYPLVFVWAYVAIAVEHRDENVIFLEAIILAVILFIYSIWLLYLNRSEH